MEDKQIKEVCVVELFKVDVTGINGLRVLGKKVFGFSDHMSAYRWLVTLPMDASHIDYYFNSTMTEVDAPQFDPEKPFSGVTYIEHNELQGARRIKDLHLVMKGLIKQ